MKISKKLKLILFHAIIALSLVIFVVMSITIYYLVPIGESAIDYLRGIVEELIRGIWR